MIRIPKNLVLESQYTSGNEYFTLDTNAPYVGYYFVYNGKAYTGKEPSEASLELEKVKDRLLKRAISTIKNAIKKYLFTPSPMDVLKGETVRFFAKRTNSVEINILEITAETYKVIKDNPSYLTLELKWSLIYDNHRLVEDAEKKFSGITDFLKTTQLNSDVTESV